MTLTFLAPPVRPNDRRTINTDISQAAHAISAQALQISRVLTGLAATEEQIDAARARLYALSHEAADLAERI